MTPSDTAHPEGEGVFRIVEDAESFNNLRIFRKSDPWCKVYGFTPEEARAKAEVIVAALSAPPSRPQGEEGLARDEALIWFLKVLNGAGGRAEASDYPWSTLNVFCDDREPTDTFNLAIEQGLTRTTHDSDTDASTVYLTDAGRAFLAALSNQGKPSS